MRVIGQALGSKRREKNGGRIKTENYKSKIQTLVLIKINPEFPKVLKLPRTILRASEFTPEDPHITQGLELVTLPKSENVKTSYPRVLGFRCNVFLVAKKTEKWASKCQS